MTSYNNPMLIRAQNLAKIARALYESACQEEDPKYLERHRLVAVNLAGLIDDAYEENGITDPDLGLEMIIFIEHKAEGSSETEPQRKIALDCLEWSENNIAKLITKN